MKITEVTVKFEETCSIPNYSNVRPSVSITAQIEPGDDPEQVRQAIADRARGAVRDEVDDALEAAGISPKYFDGPQYQIIVSRQMKVVAIIPSRQDQPLWFYQHHPGFRLETAIDRAKAMADVHDWQFYDCSSGDVARLEELVNQAQAIEEEDRFEDEEEDSFRDAPDF